MFQVIDIQTRQVVGTYETAKAARKARDRKDAQYGAVRFVVRLA